jgi:RNA polymerase sigma-70 factor (ECF subfamily)
MNEIQGVIVINRKTFEVIFFKYFARLAYFVLQFSKDRRTAADTASDVFVDLWREDHLEFKNHKALEAYLYAAIKQKVIVQFVLISDSEIDQAMIMTESVAFIHETLSDLPSPERSVVELMLYGKDTEEIAKTLGMSQDSVEANKASGLALIKKNFDDQLS